MPLNNPSIQSGGALGTPSSGTLTNCTALPQAGVTNLTTDLGNKQPLDTQLTDLAGLAYAANALKVVRVNAGETAWELATPSGSGTVTDVSSANANATVATPTTTPVITIVSAPKLQTARTIGGVSFDGTGNIVPETITTVDEAVDTACFPLFVTASGTQSLQPKNNAALTFNSSTGNLASTRINNLAITANGTNTLTIAAGKTLTCNNSVTLAGTDSTTMTFPTTSATIARTDAANTFTGVQTFSSIPVITGRTTIANTTTPLTYTSAYYGAIHFWSPAGTATATLPANGAPAGSWFDMMLLTNQTVTISAATADTLITFNDTAADSVAFSTASNKIGGCIRFISNGSVWCAFNMSNNTMTVAT